jgi:hypothetical protein
MTIQPLCFQSAEQYALWKQAEAAAKQYSKAEHCVDCQPAYQAKMLAAGRCEHPETRFREDEIGFTEGYRPR